MVHALRIVKHQIVHEEGIEAVGVEQESLVVVQKLLLESTVEPFHMSVHLRRLGTGVVVGNLEFEKSGGEVFFEFTPVVGEHERHRVGKQEAEPLEELGCSKRRVRGGGPREHEAAEQVFAGDHVPTGTMDDLLDRVEANAVARVFCLEIGGFPDNGRPRDRLHPLGTRDVERHAAQAAEVGDQAADSSRRGTRKALFTAEFREERAELFLPEVRVFFPESSQFLNDAVVPQSFAAFPRRTGTWV